MNKTITIAALVFLLVPTYAWLSGFKYRQPINITSAATVTDYTAHINITYDSDMQADFDDLRFAYANDTQLPYWIEEKADGAYAYVWFKGNWDTANDTQAYMYYGNAGASAGSLGNNTFTYWDDFLGASLSADWDNHGATINGSGLIVINSDGGSTNDYINLTVNSGAWPTGYAFSTRGAIATDQDNMFVVVGSPAHTPSEISYNQKGVEIIHTDGGGEGNYTQIRLRSHDGSQESNYVYAPDVRHYHHYEMQRQGTTQLNYWVDGRSYYNSTTQIPDDDFSFMVGEYGDASETLIDWVFIRKYMFPEPVVTFGAEQGTVLDYNYTPSTPLVDIPTTFTATWDADSFTNFWWNFTTANQSYHTTANSTDFTFTSGGYYNVTLKGLTGGVNQTATKNITVASVLSAVDITIYDYVPFIFRNDTHYISYSATGGSGTYNNSWTVTLPNTSVLSYVNQTPLTFSPQSSGIHAFGLTLCDMIDGSCASDTDNYNPWNVTGGVYLVNSTNKTESALAEVFDGDSLSFTSTDSLIWNMSSYGEIGTTADLTFNSTFAFWNDDDYYHFNVSVYREWGSHNKTDFFTAVAARYIVNQTAACTKNSYCLVYGAMFNEADESQITSNNDYDGYFLTSTGYGHELESGLAVTTQDLNASICIDATPLIDNIILDGQIAYESAGYSSRTHAFDGAEMEFVANCTTANSQFIKLYTTANTSTTTVTFTILQGGVPLEDALLTVQRYFGGTWKEVSSQLTDSNGQTQMALELCNQYYKFLVSQDGEILFSEKFCLKDSTQTIEVEGSIHEFYEVYEDLVSVCAYSNATRYLSCSLIDASGKTATASLYVYPAGSSTAVCSESESSSATTLLCDMSDQNDGDYTYKLTSTTDEGVYIVNSGSFMVGTPDVWSGDSAIIIFLLFGVLLLGATLHPIFLILIPVILVYALREMNLFSVPFAAVGWVLALAVIALIKILGGKST